MAAGLIGSLALVVSVSCSKIQDMHDSTVSMDRKTDDLLKNSEDLKKKSDDLDKKQKKLGKIIPQGGSAEVTNKAFERLLSSSGPKEVYEPAGEVLNAYVYQLFTGEGDDTPAWREDQAAEDVLLFSGQVQRCILANQDVHSPNAFALDNFPLNLDLRALINGSFPIKMDPKAMCVNAIAGRLEAVHPMQVEGVRTWNQAHPDQPIKTISMLDIIKEYLTARVEIAEGKSTADKYPKYVQKWLTLADRTGVFLLQSRYNFLAASVMAYISDIWPTSWDAPWFQIKSLLLGRSWLVVLTPPNYDASYLGKRSEDLQAAIDTYHFLQTLKPIGFHAVMDPRLAKIYQSAVVTKSIETKEKPVSQDKLAAELVLESKIHQYAATAAGLTPTPVPEPVPTAQPNGATRADRHHDKKGNRIWP